MKNSCNFIIFLFLLFFLIHCSHIPTRREHIRPFKSDGCTLVPDFNFTWAGIKHDWLYWQGGSKKDRRYADKIFKKDIEKSGYPIIAKIYYIGVRIFGHPLLPTYWRWGYGYKWPTYYQKDKYK